MTGNNPYHFQTRVAKALLEGKNVLLKAPTGSGKTLASTIPYLYSKRIKNPIGDKLIYSVPLRTLTVDIFEGIKDHFLDIEYQNGDHSVDPFFEHEVVVTTIDQTLAAYLGIPYGCRSSQLNITRGSLIGSLCIFDEFHLYDNKLGYTMLEMVKRLRGVLQYVIMTATLSRTAVNIIKSSEDIEYIELSREELDIVNRDRLKHVSCRSSDFSPEEIMSKGGRTIVICNTVSRSQHIYEKIRDFQDSRNIDIPVILLNSYFTASDRSRKEQDIKSLFGKDRDSHSHVILVSTQMIEAGLDITCEYLFTDLAPLNSLIQRIGRCARFEGEEGWVYIHDNVKENGEHKVIPYKGMKDIFDKTWNILQPISYLTLDQENSMIDDIYKEYDNDQYQKIIELLSSNRIHFETDVLFSHDRSRRDNYIRNILSSNVSVVNSIKYKLSVEVVPVSFLFSKIQKIEDGTIIGYIKQWKEEESDGEKGHYEYIPFSSAKEMRNSYMILLLENKASYNSEYGLRIGVGNDDINRTKPIIQKEKTRFSYPCEPFEVHATKTYEYALKLDHNSVASRKLSKIYPSYEINTMIEYMTKLHDIGKLNEPCQKHFHVQQQLNDRNNSLYKKGIFLAHSTYDPEQGHHYKPNPVNHSYEGAVLFYIATKSVFEEKIRALLSYCIMKHHSSKDGVTTNYISKIIFPNGWEDICNHIGLKCGQIESNYLASRVRKKVETIWLKLKPFRVSVFPLMIYFQRITRLSDFHSLDYYTKGE